MDYTLAVTSCDRFDLLGCTLNSFFQFVDKQPAHVVILNDGPELPNTDVYAGMSWSWRTNEIRIGQIRSCDRLMSQIETEWVFWCEDDWLFQGSGFIEPSFALLEAHPELVTVSLRGRAWNHPLVGIHPYPCLIAQPNWSGGWGGFTFNPGLRRKSDYLKMGTYSALGGTNMRDCESELVISRKYLAAGYRIADLGRPIIEHLGHGRSKTLEFHESHRVGAQARH